MKVVDLQSGMAVRLHRREKEIAEKLEGVDARHLIRVLDTAEVDDDLLVIERAERSLARLTQASAEIPSRQSKQQ